MERTCRRCGDHLPENTTFFRKVNYGDGWQRTCKECDAGRARGRRASLHAARARQAGVPSTLTDADIEQLWARQDHKCHYCGVQLDHAPGITPHLDHVVPLSQGGANTPENVVLACAHCNKAKATMPAKEAQRRIHRIR